MLGTKRRAVSVMNQEVFLHLFRNLKYTKKIGRFSMRMNRILSRSMAEMRMELLRLGNILIKMRPKHKKGFLNFSKRELRNGQS